MRKSSKIRNCLMLVLLSACVGVAATYAVAWSLVTIRSADPGLGTTFGSFFFDTETTGWFTVVDRQPGVVRRLSIVYDWRSREIYDDIDRDPLESWSLIRRFSPQEIPGAHAPNSLGGGTLLERAAGWPKLAVVDRTFQNLGVPVPVSGHDLSIRGGDMSGPWFKTTLAFMPLWPGFAVDTALYGSTWALLMCGAIAIRRWCRAAAGQCSKCRYDLTGLKGGVCPECGARVAPPPRSA
jgi:hypothetical protein